VRRTDDEVCVGRPPRPQHLEEAHPVPLRNQPLVQSRCRQSLLAVRPPQRVDQRAVGAIRLVIDASSCSYLSARILMEYTHGNRRTSVRY
jgi:hypothetical protein